MDDDERPSSPISDDIPLIPKLVFTDTESLFKRFQANINTLTSAYTYVKTRLKDFDKHLYERVNVITEEINVHIRSLLKHIEELNSLINHDLDEYATRLQADKCEIDKNLLEIEAYLNDLRVKSHADATDTYELEININKLVAYHDTLNSIPDFLTQNLYNLTFEASTLDKLNYQDTIGCLKNAKLIEKFEFNFSASYKPISKELWLIIDCEFNQSLLLIEWNSDSFHVIDRKTLNYIQRVPVLEHYSNGKKRVIKGLCSMSGHNQVCMIDNTSSNIYLLNKAYKLVKQIEFYDENAHRKNRSFEAIEFSADNGCLYILDTCKKSILLFDDQLNYLHEVEIKLPYRNFYSFTFKIIQNKIYLNDLLNKCYHIFDENVNYVSTFGGGAIADTGDEYSQIILAADSSSNHLLIFNHFDKTIDIYDSINLVFIKKIELLSSVASTINNAIIINNSKMIIFITDHDLQIFDVL